MTTYPKSVETLGQLKADGNYLMGHCGRPGLVCGHASILPLDTLIEKYGADYVFIGEKRIARAIVCKACGHKGGSMTVGSNWRPGMLEEEADAWKQDQRAKDNKDRDA